MKLTAKQSFFSLQGIPLSYPIIFLQDIARTLRRAVGLRIFSFVILPLGSLYLVGVSRNDNAVRHTVMPSWRRTVYSY